MISQQLSGNTGNNNYLKYPHGWVQAASLNVGWLIILSGWRVDYYFVRAYLDDVKADPRISSVYLIMWRFWHCLTQLSDIVTAFTGQKIMEKHKCSPLINITSAGAIIFFDTALSLSVYIIYTWHAFTLRFSLLCMTSYTFSLYLFPFLTPPSALSLLLSHPSPP